MSAIYKNRRQNSKLTYIFPYFIYLVILNYPIKIPRIVFSYAYKVTSSAQLATWGSLYMIIKHSEEY